MSENILVPISNSVTHLPGMPESNIIGGTLTDIIFSDGTRFDELSFRMTVGEEDRYPGFSNLDGTPIDPPTATSRYPYTDFLRRTVARLMVEHYEATGSWPISLRS